MTNKVLPHNITLDDKYSPAMKIVSEDEAKQYFEVLVWHSMEHGLTREEAEGIEKTNLGYWAGYYSNETRSRVERLFDCEHPYFGKIDEVGPPTPEQAFRMGVELAERRYGKN